MIIAFTLPQGDATMAVLAGLGGLSYVTGRRAVQAARWSDPAADMPGAAPDSEPARLAQALLERVDLLGSGLAGRRSPNLA